MEREKQRLEHIQFIIQKIKIELFDQQAINDLLDSYEQALKVLKKDYAKLAKSGKPDSERLISLYREIELMIAGLSDIASDQIAFSGVFSYQDTNRILSWEQSIKGFNNVSLSFAEIKQMVLVQDLGGKVLTEWLFPVLFENKNEIKKAIDSGLIRGTGYKTLLREIFEGSAFTDPAELKKQKRNMDTVIRSYVQTVNAKAHRDIIEANKNVVSELEWSAVMENANVTTGRGTCIRCQALDGLRYDYDYSGTPPCPLHPNCRCMLLPVTKSWNELFKTAGIEVDIEERNRIQKKWYIRDIDASTDNYRKIQDTARRFYFEDEKGETRIGKTYAEWWAGQTTEFQNNAIGPRRAELVRSGKIAFEDMVNHETGELYTIKELIGPPSGNTILSPLIHESAKNEKDFIDIHHKLVQSIPEKIAKKLESKNNTFQLSKNVTAVFPDLKGVRPRGWGPSAEWDMAEGLHRRLPSGNIVLSTTHRKRGNKFEPVPENRFKAVFYHETGHAVDYLSDTFLSDQKGFIEVYEKDKSQIKNKDAVSYFLQSKNVGRAETVANCVSIYLGDSGSHLDDFKESFPLSIEYIKKELDKW